MPLSPTVLVVRVQELPPEVDPDDGEHGPFERVEVAQAVAVLGPGDLPPGRSDTEGHEEQAADVQEHGSPGQPPLTHASMLPGSALQWNSPLARVITDAADLRPARAALHCDSLASRWLRPSDQRVAASVFSAVGPHLGRFLPLLPAPGGDTQLRGPGDTDGQDQEGPGEGRPSSATATGIWPLAEKNSIRTERVFWTMKSISATPRTTATATATHAPPIRV